MSLKFMLGLEQAEGAAPKGDPEGRPMTAESLYEEKKDRMH